ncbi:hypothetical protein MicB006_2408 [Micromonospora sp. B006]|nr:hypothetical protein MicB006_2408 [Micromonospora sp. B006]
MAPLYPERAPPTPAPGATRPERDAPETGSRRTVPGRPRSVQCGR